MRWALSPPHHPTIWPFRISTPTHPTTHSPTPTPRRQVGTIIVQHEFEAKVKVDHPVFWKNYEIHGLSQKDVAHEETFDVVGFNFIEWIEMYTDPEDDVILVAHNGKACDFPFLAVEFERHDLELPSQVKLCMDTLSTLRSYKEKLPYLDAPKDLWTKQTSKGKNAMTLESIVNFIVSDGGRDKEQTFENNCGTAHDALADVRGCVYMLMPGEYGMYDYLIEKTKKGRDLAFCERWSAYKERVS